MANETGQGAIPNFQRGKALLAKDLNRLVGVAGSRVVGAGGIIVQATRKGMVVTNTKDTQRHPAPNTIVAEITGPYEGDDAEAGEYEWEIYKGSGPETGRAIELAETTGIPEGTRVILRRAAGIWYFQLSSADSRMKITAVDAGGDSLTCIAVNSNEVVPEEAEAKTVALPRKLQKTPWHGASKQVVIPGPFTLEYNYTDAQTRTSTHIGGDYSGAQHTEVIVPAYLVGDLIVVRSMEQVVGAVTYALYDTNNDSRGWARRGVA